MQNSRGYTPDGVAVLPMTILDQSMVFSATDLVLAVRNADMYLRSMVYDERLLPPNLELVFVVSGLTSAQKTAFLSRECPLPEMRVSYSPNAFISKNIQMLTNYPPFASTNVELVRSLANAVEQYVAGILSAPEPTARPPKGLEFVQMKRNIPIRLDDYSANTIFVRETRVRSDTNATILQFFRKTESSDPRYGLEKVSVEYLNSLGYFLPHQFRGVSAETQNTPSEQVPIRPVVVPMVPKKEEPLPEGRQRKSPRFHNQIHIGETSEEFLKRIPSACLTSSQEYAQRLKDKRLTTAYAVQQASDRVLEKILPVKTILAIRSKIEYYANMKPRNAKAS